MMHRKYKGKAAYFMQLWHGLQTQLQGTRGLYEASESTRVENGKDNTVLLQTEAYYSNCNSVVLLFYFPP